MWALSAAEASGASSASIPPLRSSSVSAQIYKEALTLLLEAWGGDPDSLRAEVLQGIHSFCGALP